MIKSIALSNLVTSPRNVRRMSDPEADARLAADIAAHGLLQNLVVTPLGTPKGSYAVEAGGRRLKALQSLQEEGVLGADHKVACLVLSTGGEAVTASEASLAENLQRLAMNPADECLAFGTLIEQGADVEGIARRFGLTVRHVEGRLRLAGLHPTVFAALGAGDITLDAAKAYATTSDTERQLWVFEQLHSGWSDAHPDSIRRMMVSATVPASDRRFRFVGEAAYLAAGGRLERDLFAEADEARVLDVAVLENLAIEKLEVEAAWLANEHGYAFVRATLDGYVQPWAHEDLTRASVIMAGPSEEEREQVEALESEIDRLTDVLEDEDAGESARDEAGGRIAEIETQLREIASKPPVLESEARGTVGFFLLLDETGTPRIDRAPYALIGVDGGEDERSKSDGHDGSSDRSVDGEGRAGSGGAGNPAGDGGAAPRPKLSQRLVEELAMQRRDILALHVARDPEMAFDLAVFLMVKDEGGYGYGHAGSSLSARPPHDPVLRSQLPDAPVQALLAEADAALDRSWTGHEGLVERFDAFRALPRAAREAWLGAAVARTLEASADADGRRNTFHDHLGTLLGIEVAAHWRPTALNWFDRVPKALCLAAMTEVGGAELTARHAKGKKPEIAEACEKLFAGEGILDAEVRAAALAWVPWPMRFARPEDDGPAERNAGDESPPWLESEAGSDRTAEAMAGEGIGVDAAIAGEDAIAAGGSARIGDDAAEGDGSTDGAEGSGEVFAIHAAEGVMGEVGTVLDPAVADAELTDPDPVACPGDEPCAAEDLDQAA